MMMLSVRPPKYQADARQPLHPVEIQQDVGPRGRDPYIAIHPDDVVPGKRLARHMIADAAAVHLELNKRLDIDAVRIMQGAARIACASTGNAARGSHIALAEDFLPEACNRAIEALCVRICTLASAHPDGRWLLEMGIDILVDEGYQPWLLELNSQPLGRLGALAQKEPERFAKLHLEACMRPLRSLAVLARADRLSVGGSD